MSRKLTIPVMKTAPVKTVYKVVKHKDSEVGLLGAETWPHYLRIL